MHKRYLTQCQYPFLPNVSLYLYFRDPEEANIEDRVGEKSQDIESDKVKVQTNNTPTIEVQKYLQKNYESNKIPPILS